MLAEPVTKNPFTSYRRDSLGPYCEPVTVAEAHSGVLAGLQVLIVEDDRAIGSQLVKGLARAGCEPTAVATAAEALQRSGAGLILLDLGLPDMDGVDLCRRLRSRGTAPIIVITARGAEPDRVDALDAGADDYLVKPFGFAELLARMRAVLRRTGPDSGATTYGALRVDPAARRVWVAGRPVALTGKEFDILACLAIEPGRVVTREEIFDRVWDEHWYGPRKVLDVHVAALRRKLGHPEIIETVYGRGFRLGEVIEDPSHR
ncbi:MAG: response regulator transcription factor [Jatrophihabitans sp.]|nr:MAG: response regulator transcription factor [Jatrophihabitans sp.]